MRHISENAMPVFLTCQALSMFIITSLISEQLNGGLRCSKQWTNASTNKLRVLHVASKLVRSDYYNRAYSRHLGVSGAQGVCLRMAKRAFKRNFALFMHAINKCASEDGQLNSSVIETPTFGQPRACQAVKASGIVVASAIGAVQAKRTFF